MIDENIESHKSALTTRRSTIFISILLSLLAFSPLIIIVYRSEKAWLILLAIAILIAIFPFLLLCSSKRIIMKATKAVPVPREDQRVLEGLAEEVSLASGLQCPALALIDDDFRNAFSIKWRSRGAVFLTQGLIDTLSRDETRTVIAHELAKITYGYRFSHNPKVAIKALPTFLKSKLGKYVGLVSYLLIWSLFIAEILAIIPFVIFLFTKDGISVMAYYLCLVFGLYLVARFNIKNITTRFHALYYLADELAIKWTMHPEALVDALHETEQNYLSQEYKYVEDIFFVPFSAKTLKGAVPPAFTDFGSILRERLADMAIQALNLSGNPSVEMRIKNLKSSLRPLLDSEQ